VTFTDASTGTPTLWEWNFGDGSVATGPGSKTHTFISPDVYHVSLKVTNAGGDNTTTNDVQANLVCPSPISNFSVSPGTGRKNSTDFVVNNHSQNMSTVGCNNVWSWNWGDGSGLSSVENPPPHQYKLRGTYTISLTTSNLRDSMTSTQSVTVTN